MLGRASRIALYVVPVVRSTPLGLYVDWIAALRRSFVCYWSSIVTSLSIYLFLTNSDRRLKVCSSRQHQLIRPLPHSRLVSRSQKPLIRSSRYSSREILTLSTFFRRRCRRCCCCCFFVQHVARVVCGSGCTRYSCGGRGGLSDSLGSFFDFRPTEGAFEANPPFVRDVILKMANHMDYLLKVSAVRSVVVVESRRHICAKARLFCYS